MSDEATYSRKLRDFAELWRAKRHDGRLPARRDFAFEDMVPWLGWISILKVIDGGRDFRFTLHGTAMVERHRHDLTGVRASEMPKAWRETASPGFLDVVATPRALFTRHHVTTDLYDYAWERALVPCADDGVTPDTLILVCAEIDYRSLGPG
ncbi:MAG: hypothetical protein ACKO1J_13815 [Tagaea sp.]